MMSSQRIINPQTKIKCEKQSSLSLRHAWLQVPLFIHAVRHFLAHQVTQAIQCVNLRQGADLFRNKRITCGVILICIAPFTLVVYNLFDPAVELEGWIYYYNPYYYLFTVGPYLCLLFWALGAFLMFPTKWAFRYIAMIVPAGVATVKLLYLSLFVYSNKDFNEPIHWTIILTGVLLAVAMLLCCDYFLYRKYHLHDGNIARIIGIIDAPNIDDAHRMKILRSLSEESKNLNARI